MTMSLHIDAQWTCYVCGSQVNHTASYTAPARKSVASSYALELRPAVSAAHGGVRILQRFATIIHVPVAKQSN